MDLVAWQEMGVQQIFKNGFRMKFLLLDFFCILVFSGSDLIYSQNFSQNLAAYKSFKKF